MTKHAESRIKLFSACILAIFFVTAGYYSYRFLRCFPDSRAVPHVDPFDVIHITVFGSSADTVSGKFTLYDTSGREVAEIERSWNAQSLYLECDASCFDNRFFVFPYKIYGDDRRNAPGGTKLNAYYMEHGECLLLSRNTARRQRKALYHLGQFAFAKSVSYLSRFSRQYIIDLSSCKPGKEYMLVISQQGNLFLQPVDD
jgi:hypothetical protein